MQTSSHIATHFSEAWSVCLSSVCHTRVWHPFHIFRCHLASSLAEPNDTLWWMVVSRPPQRKGRFGGRTPRPKYSVTNCCCHLATRNEELRGLATTIPPLRTLFWTWTYRIVSCLFAGVIQQCIVIAIAGISFSYSGILKIGLRLSSAAPPSQVSGPACSEGCRLKFQSLTSWIAVQSRLNIFHLNSLHCLSTASRMLLCFCLKKMRRGRRGSWYNSFVSHLIPL